jgi:hypothetical protein
MDWSFLNIFKKADFNTLVFSLAVMGWIMLYFYPDIIYLKMIALLCSVYCISRFVVHLYHVYQISKTNKANAKYDKAQKDKRAHDRELQAQFVYDRLSLDDQKILQEIIRKGEKSCYSDVYIIKDKLSNCMFISQVQMILYSDDLINNWISINESSDSYSINIKSPLNSIVENRINK